MPDQPALRDALRDLVDDVEGGDDLRARIERQRRSSSVRPVWLAAAAVVAVVALTVVALATTGDGHDRPSRVIAEPPSKSTATTGEGDRCALDTTLLSATWVPEGWSPDPEDVPQDEVMVRSWQGPGAARINAHTGIPGVRMTGPEAFTVFDGRARVGVSRGEVIGEIECDVWFSTSGPVSRQDLRTFMSGLTYDSSGQAYGWFWPEVTVHQAAIASQRLDDPAYAWRFDATETAVRFAHEVLGWQEATGSPGVSAGEGMVRVTNGSRTADVSVVRTIAGEWWSVTRVWTFGDDDPGGSASFNAEGASVGLGYDGSFASSESRFWRGDRSATTTGTDAGGAVTFDPPWPIDESGAFLLLLKDTAGEVIHAWGSPVAAGEFAAG